MNLENGNQTRFQRSGGIYEMDIWIPNEDSPEAGFPGQGS